MVSTTVVISQFQAGGSGDSNDEFIEIHNVGLAPVDLNGHRLVYRSQNGTTDVGPLVAWSTTTIVQPGQYYLVASAAYDGTITPDVIFNNGTCACSLAAANGGLAIRQGPQNTGTVIDTVGWGTGSNIFFEGTRTTAPGNDNSQARKLAGCQDTDNNLDDFVNLAPSAPRNTATTPVVCNGGGNNLFASIAANPTNVTPGSSILFTVTVLPATTPPSTGITVIGNLSSIGGAATQTFFDDGTNGDETAGDHVFSYLAPIGAGLSPGNYVITATAADAQARNVPLQQNITVIGPLANEDPLLLGNPSNATTNVANENNYLMPKPQYSLSYNRSKATANWVAWRLDSSWIGGADRQNDFRADTTLPAGWYQVSTSDYSGSGYDRGHMCPSGDRTNTIANNSATFLMTNMIPQLAANNQGPWADLENYCRTLASQGNELYIISGPVGNAGTISAGRVVVPAKTWKVVLVLPNGVNDLSRIDRSTRVFGVIMSNSSISQSAPWRNFRTTVDAVENLTGYNFFSEIPKNTQDLIERKRDKQ